MYKRLLILFFFCGFLSSELNAQSTICNYKYRKRISFNPAQVSGASDLTNYPAMIKITADQDLRTVAQGGHVENASGFDIIFTAADGVTLLSFDLEYYGTNATNGGSVTAWVLLPTISTTYSTDIYMYYGNTAIAADQSNRATVWANYYCVYHMQANSLVDAAGNHNLTNNSTTSVTPAFINDGRSDNGTQWLDIANTFPNITTNFSMSGWARTTNVGTAGQRIIVDDQNNTGGYALSIGDPGSGAVRFYARSTTPVSLDTPNNTIANNTWYYFVAVADITGARKTIYINGASAATGTFSGTWGTDAGRAGVAGENASGETGNRLNGRMDEVRVAKTALSADWILTEYNNQNSPSTFYSVSAEPYRWSGATNRRWNVGTNWLGNAVPPSDADVIIISTANQPTLNTSPQVKSLWMQSATTLSFMTNNLSFRYDITNCGTISGVSGALVANSTTNTQTQYLSGSGTYNLANLTINNTFATLPAVVLNKDVNVSGALALTSGTLYTTATNILALGSAATSGPGSASSFVSGPMSKTGNTDFVFPIGKGASRWRRCAVTGITASDTYTAEYFYSPYANVLTVQAPLIDVSKIEYWQVDRAAAGNASLTLYWEVANTSGINNCPDLTIARWSGATWQERAGTAGGTCSGAGSGSVVTNAALTAFSPFTFGSKSSAVNPLPITLLTFTATPVNKNKVLIEWSTASEVNNDHFEIERTTDGVNFEPVGQKKGKGNSQSKNNYDLTDHTPHKGKSYYRLKQVDINGDAAYSSLVSVNLDEEVPLIYTLYPNPNSGEFTLEGNLAEVELTLYDIFGKKVEHTISNRSSSKIQVDCSGLAKGVYIIHVKTGSDTKMQKLVIE